MSLTSLPPETILHIGRCLPPSSLLSFAYVNSLTYQTIHHLAAPILARQRNTSTMINRFGSPSRHLGICIIDPTSYIAKNPVLGEKYDKPEKGAMANLEYLRLNGDLHWLLPLPPHIEEKYVWDQGEAAKPSQITSLLESAERVGVKIPPAFVKFMSSQEMIGSMYLGGDYFDLGPSLVKCLPEDDKNGGGFVITFLSDQQGCFFWALYVAPGGYSCVLDCATDVHCWECETRDAEGDSDGEHPRPAMFEGIPIACREMDHSLGHPNFEEWLCMRYFDGWNSATLGNGEDLGTRQKEYLDNFWAKKCRKQDILVALTAQSNQASEGIQIS